MRPLLLVEDDPADARLIQRAFNKAEIDLPLTRLQNGDEAVAYLAGHAPYDDRGVHPLPRLVLLDIKLPRRTGLEVLQWLRSQGDVLRRLPVVMLTSSQQPSDINRAYEFGANSYLSKPESFDDLVALVVLFRKYWLELNQNPRENLR